MQSPPIKSKMLNFTESRAHIEAQVLLSCAH